MLGEIHFILFWYFLAVAHILNLFQVPGVFGNYRTPSSVKFVLILEPFWPGTHTEFVSGAN